jgi:carbon storage regulator
MLVLSRFRDEKIIVQTPSGEEVTIMVVDVRGDKVRLGVEAPASWPVHREEVLERIEKSKAKASSSRVSPNREV